MLDGKSDVIKYCNNWYKSLSGQMALENLDSLCAELNSEIFGYYAIQTGMLSGEHDLLKTSRVAASFSLVNKEQVTTADPVKMSVIASNEQLPIATDNVDLVIASHVLETADEPHQVLREIDRILVPEGHCILIGFNPFVLSRVIPGVKSLIRKGLKQGHANRFKMRSAHRVSDWFSLLGFEVLDIRYMGFRPNIQNKKIFESFGWLDHVGEYAGPVMGKLYVFHVKKQVVAMRPHKKVWTAPAVLSGGKVVLNNTAQKIRRENYSNY